MRWLATRDSRRALMRPFRRVLHIVIDSLLDAITGLKTADSIADPDMLGPGDVKYAPSRWTHLIRAIPLRTVSPHDVFVDFGCGKGRVLYIASFYRFGRVIGVEASAALADQARANMARARGSRRLHAVEVITSRAENFEIPSELSLAYFYNPFRGEAFEAVCRNILASAKSHPRTIRIVYVNPRDEDALVSFGFAPVRRLRKIAIYEIACSRSEATTASS